MRHATCSTSALKFFVAARHSFSAVHLGEGLHRAFDRLHSHLRYAISKAACIALCCVESRYRRRQSTLNLREHLFAFIATPLIIERMDMPR